MLMKGQGRINMASKKKKSDPFVRCFEVCDPTLHPKGHTIYKVILKTIRVDIPEADVTETIVWRRYNDFKKLYKAMSYLHRALHRKEEFPPFAAGKVFGRFDSSVLNERQQSAQDLLNFVGQRHYLVHSKAFHQFFEGGEQGTVNPHSDPVLEPIRLGDDDGPDSDAETVSITSSEPVSADLEGSIRDDSEGNLGGVWRYRQVADEISLGDNDDDEQTDYTDESALNTPLPDEDMSFFDPLHPSTEGDAVPSIQDDSWLLSAMSACAKLETEDEGQIAQASGESESGVEQISVDKDTLETLLPTSQEVLADDTDKAHSEYSTRSGSDQSSLHRQDLPPDSDVSQGATGLIASPSRSRTTSGSHSESGSYLTDEFDPFKSRSGSKVEVGKGDLNFSLMGTGSGTHTPLSGTQSPLDGTPTHTASATASQLSNQPDTKATSGPLPGSQKGSPARSPRPQFTVMDLRDKGQYIVQAANQISLAQQCEANGNFEMSFNYYKSGVAILLKGVQADDNKARRDVVRRKTARYLLKAEDIYKAHLARKGPDENRWDPGQLSPATELDPSVVFLAGPPSELQNYRVLGIIDKVLLVLDKMTEHTFVIKVIHKSSNSSLNSNIVPTRCPYMVQMYKFYETEWAVYLLLQHASGGKLWTYISAYLHAHTENFVDDVFDDAHERKLRTQGLAPSVDSDSSMNVYSGQQMYIAQSSGSSTQTESLASQIPDTCSHSPKSHDSDLQALPEDTTGYSQLLSRDEQNSVETHQNRNQIIADVGTKESTDDTDQSSSVRRDSDFLSLDGSHDTSHLHAYFSHASAVQGDNVLEESSTNIVVSDPAGRGHGEPFQALLKETQPSLELFSIGSFDSDSKPGGQGSVSDYFASIPEEGSVSPMHAGTKTNISIPESPGADNVFISPVHSNHDNVIDINSVGGVTDLVIGSSVSDKPEIAGVSTNTYSNGLPNSSKLTLPCVDQDNHRIDKLQNCDVSPSDSVEEPSIYDTHRATDSDDSNDNSPCNTYTSTPLKESKPLTFTKSHVEAPRFLPLNTRQSNNHQDVQMVARCNTGVLSNTPFTGQSGASPQNMVSSQSGAQNQVSSQSDTSFQKQASGQLGNNSPKSGQSLTSSKSSQRTRTPSGRSPPDSSQAPMYRMPSQERSLEADVKHRKRTLSSVFGELDLAEEGVKARVHLPEGCVRQWAAEIIVALRNLHWQGIICQDLHPANILLGDRGHVLLTYFSAWATVDRVLAESAMDQFYVAPEVCGVSKVTPACDWWSLGVLLFELLTGKSLSSCYPAGITSHTSILVPEHVSQEGEALLQELLRYNPKERLGSGVGGPDDICHHPFFSGIDWKDLQG